MNVFDLHDVKSGDGMLTTVWGPCMWHFLHTMSFNYPVHPTAEQKRSYKAFMLSLTKVLPCKHCRDNLAKNYKKKPLTDYHMQSRHTFSKYVFGLHETVNAMLEKDSKLTFEMVRERYEHFRARCNVQSKEKGCTEPLLGKKCKSVISIVPQDKVCPSLTIMKSTLRRKIKSKGTAKCRHGQK